MVAPVDEQTASQRENVVLAYCTNLSIRSGKTELLEQALGGAFASVAKASGASIGQVARLLANAAKAARESSTEMNQLYEQLDKMGLTEGDPELL